MNRLLSLLLALVMAAPLCAADTPPAAPVAPAVAKTESYRDAFLSFALEKAKTYSGAVEEAVAKGVDVASKELPETLTQWLKWRAWYNGVCAFVPPLFLIAFVLLQVWVWPLFEFGYRKCLTRGNELHVATSIAAWVGIAAGLCFTLIVSVSSFFDLIQIWVAPRIYVIEQVIQLAKH